MFEGLVKDAENTALLNLFKMVDEELDGVEARLRGKTTGSDSMAMMLAFQQLDLLDVWRPMIKNLVTKLETKDANTADE